MVEKLNDIIKHRYGKGLSIQRLAGIGQELNQEASLRGEDLFVPIFVKDIFLGYGRVHEARDLSSEDQNQLARLVRMVLEPHLYSQHLERTLHNIEIEKDDLVHDEVSETKTRGLFLYGTQSKSVQKIALEIHDLSQNWAYLPFTDVAAQIQTVKDLEGFDSTTLVVDLEKNLSTEHQALFGDYFHQAVKGPLILFVSSKGLAQLQVENHLAHILSSMDFSVDRLPLNREALNEVLEMLYFKS